MKKMISLLVVLALLTAGMVIAAFATDNTVIAVEKTVAAAGEEVTLEVVITNNPGFAAAKFTVEYDETALTLVGVDTTGCLLEGATENDAKGVVAFAATSNKTEDGVLFTVTFTVNEEAAEGDYAVSVSVGKLIQADRAVVEHTVEAGAVTVADICLHDGTLVHMEAVDPACHYEGHVEHWYCTECDTVWTDEALTQISNHKSVILPATGGEVIHVEAKAPTCTEEGNIEYWYCEECEQVWQDEALTQLTNFMNVKIGVVDHTLVHMEAVDPACHYEGHVEHWYCTECDTVWTDEALTQVSNHLSVILPELGGEVVHVEAVEATCMQEGNMEHWYCEECEQVWLDEARTRLSNHMSVKLGLGEHKLVHMEAVDPACHYEGHVEHWYCTVCDNVWTDEALTQVSNHKSVILPATGGEVIHVEAKAPTCTEEGNIEYWYCEECEQVWQDEALTQLTNIKNVVLGMIDHVDADNDGFCDCCGMAMSSPGTGDSIYVAVAAAIISMMSVVALTKKKEN